MKWNRSLKNFLVAPREQAIFGLRVLLLPNALVLFVALLLSGPLIGPLFQVQSLVEATHRSEPVSPAGMMKTYLGIYAVTSAYFMLYVVVVSHRIFGPMVSLHRYVQRILDNEPQGDLILRKDDYFHDLAELLSRLNKQRQPPA